MTSRMHQKKFGANELRRETVRRGCGVALALIVTASFSLPGFTAEPDGPAGLVAQTEPLRISVENRLSASSPSSGTRKAEQDALVKFYAQTDQGLLWVDNNGLTQRAKSIIAEIGQADQDGLRASDYELPNLDGFSANDPKA